MLVTFQKAQKQKWYTGVNTGHKRYVKAPMALKSAIFYPKYIIIYNY